MSSAWPNLSDLIVDKAANAPVGLVGAPLAAGDFAPASFSASGSAAGALVPAGYGISAADFGRDDYAGLDVRGKIALVRRFVPGSEPFKPEEVQRRYGDLRYKAWNAREHGAAGLVVVDSPEIAAGETAPDEAPLPALRVDDKGDAGIPVALVKRAVGAPLFGRASTARLTVDLAIERAQAWNVVGKIAAGAAGMLELERLLRVAQFSKEAVRKRAGIVHDEPVVGLLAVRVDGRQLDRAVLGVVDQFLIVLDVGSLD